MYRTAAACLLLLIVDGGLATNVTEESTTAPDVEPGFKARVTQKGLDFARDFVTEYMVDELSNLRIPEHTIPFSSTSDLILSNIRMTQLPRMDSDIRPISGVGLRWNASGIEPILNADYLFSIRIWGFTVRHSGSVQIVGSNITFDLRFIVGQMIDGRPDISVDECEANGPITLIFTGSWSAPLNAGVDLMDQDTISNLLTPLICAIAREQIEDGAARVMQYFPVTQTFDEMFELNLQMVKSPVLYDEAVETFHKGELHFVYNGVEQPLPFTAPEMPTYTNHTSKMLYMYVSDYLFNSGLFTAYNSGRLTYNVSRNDVPEDVQDYLSTFCPRSLCLGTLFPVLSLLYPDGGASFQFYATDSPRVDFVDGEVVATAAANAEIYIETNESRAHVLTIYANVTAAFTIGIQGQHLTFDVVNVRSTAGVSDSALGEPEGAEAFVDIVVSLAIQALFLPKLTEIFGIVIPGLPAGVNLVDPEVIFVDPHVVLFSTDISFDMV